MGKCKDPTDCTVHLMQLLHSRVYGVHYYCGFCPQDNLRDSPLLNRFARISFQSHPGWVSKTPASQWAKTSTKIRHWMIKIFQVTIERYQSKSKSTRIRLTQLAYSWFELDSIRICLPDRQDVTCLVSVQARWEAYQDQTNRMGTAIPSDFHPDRCGFYGLLSCAYLITT